MDLSNDGSVGLDSYADLDGPLLASPIVWLSKQDEQSLEAWKEVVPQKLLTFTLMWAALHLCSMLVSAVIGTPDSSMAEKDRANWHNKVVAGAHAALATVQGLWWVFYSGEWEQTGTKVFGFFPANAEIAAMGVSYFIYDTVFCISAAKHMKGEYLPQILMHHAIFLAAYASTLFYPCVLSVNTYHLFQLTELSTVLLHVTWMQSKAQVNYSILFYSSVVLLATFVIRLFTNAYIVWYVIHVTLDLELWAVNVPAGYEMWRYYHILYFVGGTVGMMAMNWYWFTALVARARGMIKRVQSGRPPTSDYERAPAKKES